LSKYNFYNFYWGINAGRLVFPIGENEHGEKKYFEVWACLKAKERLDYILIAGKKIIVDMKKKRTYNFAEGHIICGAIDDFLTMVNGY